jgi:hypothetical protein
MGSIRKPFFFLALGLLALAVLVELGSTLLLERRAPASTVSGEDVRQIEPPLPPEAVSSVRVDVKSDDNPPGLGISYLPYFDFLLLASVGLLGVAMIIGDRISGRVQGVVRLVVSVLLLFAVLVGFFKAMIELTIMVVLFTSAPFGTAAYFAIFADFDRTGAAVVLSLVILLKIGFVVCLALAQPRFLKQMGLMSLVATSFLLTIVVMILHNWFPRFLVSITDAIGAIVIAIVAFIWAIVFLIFAIVAIIKALRFGKSQQDEAPA